MMQQVRYTVMGMAAGRWSGRIGGSIAEAYQNGTRTALGDMNSRRGKEAAASIQSWLSEHEFHGEISPFGHRLSPMFAKRRNKGVEGFPISFPIVC